MTSPTTPIAGYFTEEEWSQLLKNGQAAIYETLDPLPVVKLFAPGAGATWLLTEIDPEDQDLAFGLCDLGDGLPHLGGVSLSEIRDVDGRLLPPVEKDLAFKPTRRLSEYAEIAREAGKIIA